MDKSKTPVAVEQQASYYLRKLAVLVSPSHRWIKRIAQSITKEVENKHGEADRNCRENSQPR
jgi:hypothetical protein